MEGETRQDGWRKDVSIDFYKLRGGERRFKIEVGEVHIPKESIRRDNRVEKNVDTGERSDEGGGRDRRLETVAAGGASHAPVDARVVRPVRAG